MVVVRRLVTALALVATTVAIAPLSHADGATGGLRINPHTGLRVGFLPTRHQVAKSAALRTTSTQIPNLQYFGGPVLAHAQVETVLWGTGTYLPEVAGTGATDINTATANTLTSEWGTGLGEYSTPSQQIGPGSVLDRRTIAPSPAASVTTINDSEIQSELVSQVSSGALASPTTNIIYTLYFPSSTTICDDSGGGTPLPCSNNAFCGYHGATDATVGGLHLLYIVQPYADQTWMSGCSDPNESGLSATERVTSHELAETITDPQVSLVTSYGPPLGWYDTNYGEVADICEPTGSPAAPALSSVVLGDSAGGTYTVSHVWSQAANECLPIRPEAPTGVGAQPISGGRVQVTWSAANDHRAPITSYDISQSAPGGTPVVVATGVSGLSWTSPAFADGTSESFYVTAHNVLGQSPISGASTATVDGTAPKVTLLSKPQFVTSSGLTFNWFGSDNSGVVLYDAKYVIGNAVGGWSGARTLVTRTPNKSISLPVTRGFEYCLKIRASDRVGNMSAWTPAVCATAVADDRALALVSGWSHVSIKGAYLGTLTTSHTVGSVLKTTVAGNKIALLGTSCARCGVVGVYMGSTLVGKIRTDTPTTHYGMLWSTPAFAARKATLVFKVLSGAVQIDGFGFSRNPPAF